MKRVLVLGRGYVGGGFASYMRRFPDYEITAVSSRGDGWKGMDFSGFDAVFNASGLAHANARKAQAEAYYTVNGRLPVELARKAKAQGVPLFVHMSSIIVYGDMSPVGQEKTLTFDTVPEAPTVYGKSKRMAEEGLTALADDIFSVAIIRAPLVYGEYAGDNFRRLVKLASFTPIFPDLSNAQSMIYLDNLCELVHLIIENRAGGYFYPQQREYISTSRLVADIAAARGKSIRLTGLFNGLLHKLGKKPGFVRKAFGSLCYAEPMSDSFGRAYEIVDYEESVERIAKGMK